MSATVSRRERAALGFFWVVVIAIGAMTLVVLIKGPAPKTEPQAQAAPDAAAIKARIAQLEAQIKAAPGDVNAILALGDAYLDSRRAMEAFRLYQRVIELEPGNVHALSDLGSLYQQIGQYDKALTSYQRAYKSQPNHSGSLLNMALIYSRYKGENAKALELLRTFLDTNPEIQLASQAQQEIARIEQMMKETGNAAPYPPKAQ